MDSMGIRQAYFLLEIGTFGEPLFVIHARHAQLP
jgi:hypothetical protein